MEKARDGCAFWAKGRETVMGAGSRVWTEHLWTLASRCPGAAEERPCRPKGLRLAGAGAELLGAGLEPRSVVNPSAKLLLPGPHIPSAARHAHAPCLAAAAFRGSEESTWKHGTAGHSHCRCLRHSTLSFTAEPTPHPERIRERGKAVWGKGEEGAAKSESVSV